MNKVSIAFPELSNPTIAQAVAATASTITPVPAGNLDEACALVASGTADALIAGIEYTSRSVILACRDIIGASASTFSASFVMTKDSDCYVIGDAAACKHPTAAQLYDIALQTYHTAQAVLPIEPTVALLSFSTMGSGGKDPSITQAQSVIRRLRTAHPDIQVDGEMQLDAAINPRIAKAKAPGSSVAGRANVLILPDLNSGNILYKAMEQFGGFTAAGPILQGFNAPCSDLSRGSTTADVISVINVIAKQVQTSKASKERNN